MYFMTQSTICTLNVTQRTDQKRERNKERKYLKVVSRETIAIAASLAINDGM